MTTEYDKFISAKRPNCTLYEYSDELGDELIARVDDDGYVSIDNSPPLSPNQMNLLTEWWAKINGKKVVDV